MKKLVIFILFVVCIGCSEYVVRDEFPQAIMGTLPNGLDIKEAEDIISNSVIFQKWNITDRAEGWMKIYKAVDFYDLYGSITYNENNYTISMDNIVSPVREEYEVNVSTYRTSGIMTDPERVSYDNARSKLFNKHASKLARAIQKSVYRVYTKSSEQQKSQSGTGNAPIIINNNIGR